MSEKRVTRQYEVEFKLDAVRLVEGQHSRRLVGGVAWYRGVLSRALH